MTKISNRPCWMIMNCGPERVHCPAFQQADRPCWEVVSALNDYRMEGDICRDCVVAVLKRPQPVLSTQEISAIAAQKDASFLRSSDGLAFMGGFRS